MRAIFEAGIGCDRAVVIEDGRTVEAHLELPGLRMGDVWEARLYQVAHGIGGLRMPGHPKLDPVPPWATEGMIVEVEVVREAILEPDRYRPANVRALGPAADDASTRVGETPLRPFGVFDLPGGGHRLRPGPGLRERLAARGIRVTAQLSYGPDLLESASWSEALEQARTGRFAFAGGELVIERTAAFETIDVDGHLRPADLALAAAPAIGAAIQLFDLTGAIVIDFPTLGSRAARTAVDAALEAELPRPFERTAMNGFGLVQVIRPKLRPSLIDQMQGAPAFIAALALLRQAERTPGAGTTTIAAHPAVAKLIASDHLAELERRTGRPARVHPDPARGAETGHVHAQP